MDNNFTLFCISNGSELEFPKNTLTWFKNKLPVNLEIKRRERSKWCVALESICFSTTFGNINWPQGPSFISVSHDYHDKLHRQETIYKDNDENNLGVENKSITIGEDHSHFQELDKVLRDKLMLGTGKSTLIGEKYHRMYFDGGYSKIAKKFKLRDIYYYYPDDIFCTIDNLAKYFETITKHSGIKVEVGHNYIELLPNTDPKNLDCWFLINTKLINNNNSHFNLDVEYNKSEIYQYQKSLYHFTLYPSHDHFFPGFYSADVQHIEKDVIQLKQEEYKVFMMCPLIKKLRLTLIRTKQVFPKIVKVQCENASHQIFDSKYSKDLAIFCPSLKSDDKYFFKEFETKQFIPLCNTTLNHIDIRLVDQSNKQLRLVDGYATIVKLHMRKMPSYKKFFNVRLTSRRSKFSPENDKNNFKVRLPNTLNFEKRWKVSVTSINHPTVFNTLPKNSKIRFIQNAENIKVHSFSLEEKYQSVEELVNDLISKFDSKKDIIEVSHISNEKRLTKTIRFKFLKDGVFIMPVEVANVLGNTKPVEEHGIAWIITTKPESETNNTKSFNLDMGTSINLEYYQPNYIMMYSNIVAPTILGGDFKNILKVFPVLESNHNNYTIQEFKHFEYYDLANHEVKDVEISFRSHSGDKVFFGSEYDIIVNLLFTNYDD